MKQGRFPRALVAASLNDAIEVVGGIKATGRELVRLNRVYQSLLTAREWVGVSEAEMEAVSAE